MPGSSVNNCFGVLIRNQKNISCQIMKRGGEFLGSGNYGCVFMPPIDCKQPCSLKRNQTIGKVFENKAFFDEEVEKMKIVRDKIDKEEKFSIHFLKNCKIRRLTKKDIKGMPETSSCKNISPFSYQLIYPYGGIDLYTYLDTKKSDHASIFIKLFSSLESIIEGLIKIANSGYAHMDIKPTNILFIEKTQTSRLIDWGLMRDLKYHIYTNYDSLLSFKYMFFPLELHVFNLLIQNKHVTKHELKEHLSSAIQSGVFRECNIDVDEELQQLVAIVKNNSDYKTVFEQWKTKIDVYAMGITLFDLLSTLKHDDSVHNDFKDVVSNIKHDLIANAVHINPFLRSSPVEIYEDYMQIKNKILKSKIF